MFTYKTSVKLHETDAAGRLFFADQLKWAHDAYESLLESLGIGLATILAKKSYFFPIVHCQAEYKKPLFVGERLTIEITVEKLGLTSATFAYRILNDKNVLVGTAKTVHVAVLKKTGKKINLPVEIRKALSKV